jgi:hypothetical protein
MLFNFPESYGVPWLLGRPSEQTRDAKLRPKHLMRWFVVSPLPA